MSETSSLPCYCAPLIKYCRFYTFPDYIEKTTFGVSCDAFANLKECLTKHKPMVADYLEKNYDKVSARLGVSDLMGADDVLSSQFFAMYTTLLQSPNYVTKRQSLKLLGEILLDRTNFNVMTRYISNEENLKLMMNLLKDKSKNIQFEAFHVFKVVRSPPVKPVRTIADLTSARCFSLSQIRKSPLWSRTSYGGIGIV